MSNAVDPKTVTKITEILYKLTKGDKLIIECIETDPNRIMQLNLNPPDGPTKKGWRWPPK